MRNLANNVQRPFHIWINDEKSFFKDANLCHVQGVAKLSSRSYCWVEAVAKGHISDLHTLVRAEMAIKGTERYERGEGICGYHLQRMGAHGGHDFDFI